MSLAWHRSSCASAFSFGTWALNLAFACCVACQCLACLRVYHPFAAPLVREQAVTVSHAYCPCASSSNLSIPPHHALRTLHKMCISRTALSPAHAERTCSVALLSTYHGRISASNTPQLQIPANENAQKREGERERKDSARYKEWAKSHTNRHNTSWTNGKAVTFPTHLQTWLMWVFVSVGVYVKPDTRLTDMLTLLSWNSWESSNLRSCNITRARAEAQYPERGRHPRYLWGDQLVGHTSVRPELSFKRDTCLQFTGRTLRALDTFPSTLPIFALHGAGVLRKAVSRLSHLYSKDFCSSLVTFTDANLQVCFKVIDISKRHG